MSLDELMDVKYLEYIRCYLEGNKAVQKQTTLGTLGGQPSWGAAGTSGGRVEHPVLEVGAYR